MSSVPSVPGGPARRVPAVVEPGPPLGAERVQRWSRHLLLPQLGEPGQRRLANASVCVVGAGGLGSPVLLYLAAAGVGRIGVVDPDEVELSNLQRQVVHGRRDVGRAKVDSARDAVHRIDDGVQVTTHHLRLTHDEVATAEEVLGDYDLVVDGTDNFATRYLVNDICVRLGLPEVWGSVYRFDAQVSVFWGRPPRGSGVAPVQLRDLFPEPPPPGSVPSCAEGGVLGALCGQVGSVMATEAIKLLTGVGEPLLGRVLVLDALAARWSEVPLVGGATHDRPALQDSPRAGSAVPTVPPVRAVPTMSARHLAELLAARAAGTRDLVVLDVREPAEHSLVAVPGSRLLPLADLLAALDDGGVDDLPRDAPVVVLCRTGTRSDQAARALQAAGYADVVNLDGGVLAWVDDVDPSLARY
ncbi:MAG: UBA/THIF-type binding protein [Actinotalea sp.]|nr:UBA/THIF-type binding protein [Actinotalea sp.]